MYRRAPAAPSQLSRMAVAEEGAAILEFALVLPLLIALVAGTVEIGRALLVQRQMSEATRAGARALARAADPACNPACSAEASRVVAGTVERIARATGLPARQIAVTVIDGEETGFVGLRSDLQLGTGFFGLDRLLTLRIARYEARIGA